MDLSESTAIADRGDDIRAHALPGLCGPSFFTYVPASCDVDAPVLVFVHGYNRRVQEQLRLLRPLADRTGRALVAPYFSRELQPRYQRLGRGSDGRRADGFFDDCVAEATAALGLRAQPFVLLGFSGGAQFAHRYAMLRPGRVAQLIAIAAGWYTFPDSEEPFPRGLDVRRKLRRADLNPEHFLAVPTTVIVGEDDCDDVNVRRSAALDRQQGRTRVERARRWVLAMRMAARRYRVATDIVYQEVPAMDHDFERFVERGRLRELIQAAIDDCGVRPLPDEDLHHAAAR
jgi:pimeloyl-ACP methyl ester carboxylesterase